MYHKINIKFGEVNNLADARYAAGSGATFLGFNLSPTHSQYVSPDKLKEISGWAAGPTLVSEWQNEISDVISDTCHRLEIEYVQLNVLDPAVSAALKTDFCVIQNIDISGHDNTADIIGRVNKVNGLAMYYILSFKDLANQEMFLSKASNRLLITEFCREQPILLNFHFNKENLLPLLDEFQPFGINLNGSSELKPGIKDFEDLNELISLLDEGL